MKTFLLIGVVLLAVSAWPLLLMWREVVVASSVNARYSVERIGGGSRGADIGGHTVRLEDDLPVDTVGDLRVDGKVRIVVDGRDYSNLATVKIRQAYRDANRYWGYVYLMRLVDHQENTEQLVVAQSLGYERYRTVSTFSNGRVVQDEFDYQGRCEPPVRSLVIRYVVSHPSGFCSDVMQVWPSILYPVLYPRVSGFLGLICVVIAGGLKVRRRNQNGLP